MAGDVVGNLEDKNLGGGIVCLDGYEEADCDGYEEGMSRWSYALQLSRDLRLEPHRRRPALPHRHHHQSQRQPAEPGLLPQALAASHRIRR